jgi:hemolysin activation/secretion protein
LSNNKPWKWSAVLLRKSVARAALGCLLAASALSAQAAPLPGGGELPGSVQPGHDRPLPTPPEPPQPYDFRIEAPHRSAVPRDVDTIKFKLRDIQIQGATTLPAETFRPFYADLIGKDVTLSDIYNVADNIELAYREAGYPLVRAYVPPQRVKDGVFTIKVVEGYVAAVSVEGGDAATQAVIRSYMAPVLASKPLRLAVIERALLVTNDLPGITASGVLRASASTPGASDLIVTIAQPGYSGGLAVDNRGSRFSGEWTVTGDAEVNSVFTGADQLAATITASPDSLEQIGGSLRYRAPIGDDGLMGSLLATVTHGEPGSTLHAFDLKTDSYAVGPRLSYPLIRSRAESLSLDGGFTVQDAKVDILGTGLSHDSWRVVDLDANYLRSDFLGGSLGATLDLAQGLHILGATDDGSPELSRVGAKTDFTKLAGGARITWPLPDAFSVSLATQGQYSFDPLVTGEQVTFGGTQIGRGYDPGAITGDSGIAGSFELRYDTRITDPLAVSLQPYVFYDAAATWYINHGAAFDPALRNETIDSVGSGVRFGFEHGITLGLELDRTLRAVPGSDGGKKATKVLVDAAIRF